MFTETKNDDENEMLKATRKSLQEANDRIETQRLKIHELENELVSAKETCVILSKKDPWCPVCGDKAKERAHRFAQACPPFGN